MKQIVTRSLLALLIITGLIVPIALWQSTSNDKVEKPDEINFELENEADKIKTKVDRSRYFFRMLKDPATNTIPPNIRKRELRLAQQQPTRSQNPIRLKRKDGTVAALEYEWESAGPFDVGGRTRALGIDQSNPNIMIAGGTSGGIWKSTDGGTTWDLKTDPSQHMSVTSVAQDPMNQDTWYFTSGELRGNTASDRGGTALYYGTGVFMSDDNGETWNKIPETDDNDTSFNSPYDFISRVVVSPVTSSVFIASNGIGIYRSTNTEPFPEDTGPGVPNPILGTPGGHLHTDIAVGSDGRLVASLSSERASASAGGNPGIFVSFDDGDNWNEITSDIENFPTSYERSVIDIAPSAPDTVYIMTYSGTGSGENEDVRLHFVDLNNLQSGGEVLSEERTDNIPDFGGDVGYMSTQTNYNMEVAVKPDNPDFVLIGGINLFRTRDGFKSSPTGGYGDGNKDEYWVGGYAKANNISIYPNQHPDQHVVKFHPNNPDIAFAGHDGGLSTTTNIGADAVSWENLNNGYVTTQYYTVDIPESPADRRLIGGTQDNGTPFFRFNSVQSQQTQAAVNIFTGDGGYAFFTPASIYVSAQNGVVLKWETDSNGNPARFDYIQPAGASNQVFIHPYTVDPNDQNIMYYPDGDSLWRNTDIGSISNSSNSSGTDQGWRVVTEINSSNSNYQITSLEVSKSPSDILYYGTYSLTGGSPRFFRLDNASTSTNPQEISITGADNGSYPHDIAVNPSNGNELLVVFSNYEVPSIFHSSDGGDTWQDVEGNLNSINAQQAGPSVRSATVLPGETGNIYLLGTSTGIYSTTTLDGSNTQWIQEGSNSIGFTVTEFLASRTTDGTVAAGTHGRGIFKGDFQSAVTNVPSIQLSQEQTSPGEEITITATNFSFSSTIEENHVLFDDVTAEITSATQNELTVVVPRVPSKVSSNDNVNLTGPVQVQVRVGGQTVSAPIGFNVTPPQEFQLHQNYPNPFNPTTTIPVDLPSESGVIIQIFDMSGRKVLEPVRKIYPPNNYDFEVDLSGLASGVYIYRVVMIPQDDSGGNIIKSKKMTLIK